MSVIKGQTVSSSYKPALLTNGIKIIPPFVETEDSILFSVLDQMKIRKNLKFMKSISPNLKSGI